VAKIPVNASAFPGFAYDYETDLFCTSTKEHAVLKQLQLQCQTISLEALDGPMGLYNAIEKLPPFLADVKSFFQKAVAEPNIEIPSTYSKLAKKIATARYTDLTMLRVYVPAGLTIPYLDYLESLTSAEETILKIPADVLNPFSFYLAQLLTNPGELSSQRPVSNVKGFHVPDVDALNKKIMKGVNGADKTSERPYGQMVKRNADWGQIEKMLEDLNHHMVAEDRKGVVAKVEEITSLVDTLIARIQNKEEGYDVSGQTVGALAKVCYEVAQVLESYSVYVYQLRLTTVAIEDTQQYLDKVIDNILKRA
jgi:hypothetical protein